MTASVMNITVELAPTSCDHGRGGEDATGSIETDSPSSTATNIVPVLEASVTLAAIDINTHQDDDGGGQYSINRSFRNCHRWDWVTKCTCFVGMLLVGGTIALAIFMINDNNPKAGPSTSSGLQLSAEEYYDLLYHHLADNRQVAGLQDPSTAVYEALNWMAFEDGLAWQLLDETSPEGIQTQAVEQRFVVAVFYHATSGAGFWDPDWLKPGQSECEYSGIFCQHDKDNETAIVTGVELQGQSLIGSIPSQLSWLTGLQRLILTSNRLSGSIPTELFSNLVQLELLDLGFNKLTGPLPTSLSSLVQLQRFSVDGNRLTGSFPSRLPPSLQILELNANPFLSGTLPLREWSDNFLAEKTTYNGTTSRLTMLDIGATAISGTIHGPSFATNTFEQLTSFALYGTRLTGTIPTEIGHLSNLRDLGFSDLALLTGTLPTQLYELTNLEKFIMVSVEIHGAFLQNARISQLSNLRSLTVTNSHLSGTLPTELGLLTELEELRIAYSYMTGTIPSELGRLTKLEAGWFHGTQLTGSVPSEVCALPAIQFDWRISCQVECGCCHYCV